MLASARPAVRPIAFDRHKYGMRLQVDACTVGSIDGFIKTPEAHRLGFYEIALVTSGRGALELAGTPVEVAPYRVCLTRPGEARRWQLDDARLEGRLAFFEADFLDGLFAEPGFVARLPVVSAAAHHRSIALSRQRFDDFMALAGAMADELAAPRSDSSDLLRADVYRLLVMLQRASGVAPAPEADAAARLATRFAGLVAADVRAGCSVATYAESLGVTTRALNRCLRGTCGRSAGELIQQQLVREAKRLLLQTALSVSAIAERLEFSDAAYFSRFFKRHLGLPPGAFRQRHGSAIAGANVHCEAPIDR